MKVKVLDYEVTSQYKGDKPSPFNPNLKFNHVIKVENKKTGNFCFLDHWNPDRELSRNKLARAFCGLAHSSMAGMTNPEVFCALMRLDPHDPISKDKFLACRNITEKLDYVLTHDYREILNALGFKKETNQ